ncbi:MAG: BlaI/MecI/CopY family transcriptional regulator [Candidatus Magasanikbacteria bacterium]|nr:BlaI/MecI/CopY family transcriptional regulator [Candidatus Magasanikbacteria bacterium]
MKPQSKLNYAMGELEAEVMEVVWKLKNASVREVLAVIKQKKQIAYTTIMTVMSRLFDKGILKRKMDEGGAYVYQPTRCRESFLAAASKLALQSFIREYGDVAVAQFVDIVESSDSKQSKEWKKKLKELVR